jgi:bisphosphoglycerate-independent phosphoglycerate mutase (AlkP superfamily)
MAFKNGSFFNSKTLASWLPAVLNAKTVVHVELLLPGLFHSSKHYLFEFVQLSHH